MDTPPLDTTAFDLRGSHYEIGVANGQGSAPLALPTWWPEPPPLDFARACEQEIVALDAPLIEELHGYADGQGQPYEQLLQVICRPRLGGRIRTGSVPPIPPIPEQGGCTGIAWRTTTGLILVGRNYDFYPVQRIRQRIRLHPDAGRATLGMRGSVPAGRYDGVNDAGLFVSLHVVLTDRVHPPRPGVPFHLIPRILLEMCRTMDEVITQIMRMAHLHSFNYLIADPVGFCCVECHPDRVRIVYPGDARLNILAVGNFYRHPDMRPLQNRREQHISRQRVAYLESGVWQDQQLSRSWTTTQAAMQDHTAAVCGHTGGHTTLWSCVADLTEKRIAYTLGAPCCEPYSGIRWPE